MCKDQRYFITSLKKYLLQDRRLLKKFLSSEVNGKESRALPRPRRRHLRREEDALDCGSSRASTE